MSQVSYGTITITDTNDIERIYIEYCRSTSNQLDTSVNPPVVPNITVAWGEKTPSWVNGQYIWQRSVIKKTGSTNLTYGTPVCLTGAVGATGAAGQSLTATKTEYTIAASNVTINLSNHTSYTWTANTPDYNASKPVYWGRITNTYTNPSKTEYLFYKDEALSKAVADAAIANSIAQQTIEDSQGAMSQAASAVKEVKRIWFVKATSDLPTAPPKTGVTTGSASTYNSWSIVKPAENSSYPYYFYCDQTCTNGGVYSHSEILLEADPYTVNALNVRTKNFFHGKDSTYDGWFASGRSTSEGLKENDATTYYYNARVGATNITLGYNKTPVIDLDGGSGAINIYRLPTINSSTGLVTAAGKLGAKLNASALTFYNTSGTATSTFGDSIALASNGASITVGSTSTGKYNTYIDAQGLYLRTGTTSYATLNSNGLVLSKGGIRVNTVGSNNGVYISSENLGSKVTSLDANKTNWRAVIGSKFGVDSEGNLYANKAHISGTFTVEAGSESNIYTKDESDEAYDAKGAADKANLKAASRGEQLVVNGNGLMGDNTNFSQLVFDGSQSCDSPGSFTRTGGYAVPGSDEYFPIDTSKRYRFEFDMKSSSNTGTMYSFIDFYDVDKKQISANNYMYFSGTTTTLAQELKSGDTVVKLTDVSGYKTKGTASYLRALTFWDYTNSFGYTYPKETYSRNYYSDAWTDDTSIDKSANTITLKRAYSGPTRPAGTFVSQGTSGSKYKYGPLIGHKVPTEWTHYVGYFEGVDYSGANKYNMFPPGTAYARVGFLWNYNSATDQFWVTNIQVYEDYKTDIDTALAKKSIHTIDSSYSQTYTQLMAWSKEGYDAGQWAVSSTAGVAVGDTVRIKCLVSDMNNAAVYVLGTVTAVTSATILRMTSHGLDTTVIDGGNILTNSITADQIKGNTLTLGKISTDVQNRILDKTIDTRNDNQPPSWYITNYPRQTIREFKSRSVIGVGDSGYCDLVTKIPWDDRSGGYPSQTAECAGKQFWRQGKSDTEWTEWVDAAATATDYLTFTETDGLTIGKTGKKERVNIKSSGINVYDSSDASVAEFGSTARIGKSNSSRFVTNAASLQAYNASNQKYFEVSASGITFGTNTVAKTSDIPTNVSQLTNDSNYQNATQVTSTATTKADAAAWSVELETTSIDLLNNLATIKATVYKYGVKQTDGFTRAWYKDGSVISDQDGESIVDVSADALYTCVIT